LNRVFFVRCWMDRGVLIVLLCFQGFSQKSLSRSPSYGDSLESTLFHVVLQHGGLKSGCK
jgi:hypothetical protein